MKRCILIILFCALTHAGIVEDVRDSIARGDFAGGDRQVATYQRMLGQTTELAAAISWLGRGSLAAKNYDRAEAYAEQARTMAQALMRTRSLSSDSFLQTALGAAIEVQAQALAARGETSRAVSMLRKELQTYGRTPIAERIAKNLNLLSLEGKPAPELSAREWIGTKPASLASLRGKPVLLFFWAHWCPDCKEEVPIIARLMQRYGPRGLTLVGPTKYYGYVANGEDAPPAVEKRYIEEIRKQYYSPLASMIIPLADANFETYGCSSTPTLAIVDKQGIVRWYHPGAATEQELIREIEKVI